MQADGIAGWYVTSYVVVLAIVTVQQKRGHTFFPSAASALALCMIWPIVAAITLAVYFSLLVGDHWAKIENWWDTYP